MSYLSLSEKDKKDMLAAAGVGSIDELFCCIPEEVRLKRDLRLPEALTELELARTIEGIGRKNDYPEHLSFLGGGAYEHFVPAVVDSLSSRGEFVSPYTPYQPEVSQGTLQIIFEFQTLICQLTGLAIANASLYDGRPAAEAVLMAQRVTGRPKVLIAGSVHPQYREVVRTYVKNVGIELEELPYGKGNRGSTPRRWDRSLDDRTAPSFSSRPIISGSSRTSEAISEAATAARPCPSPWSPRPCPWLLERLASWASISSHGEAQSFGVPLSFGGPYLGFMACPQGLPEPASGTHLRPDDGRRRPTKRFVLTLSTREQHIRRERATSNICTNQALCALRATIFLAAMGRAGPERPPGRTPAKRPMPWNACRSRRSNGFPAPFFNEFVLRLPQALGRVDKASGKGIVGGLGLDKATIPARRCALVCVTELKPERTSTGWPRLEEVLSMIREIREPLFSKSAAEGKGMFGYLAPLDVPESADGLRRGRAEETIDGFPRSPKPKSPAISRACPRRTIAWTWASIPWAPAR
jgi:glycine dehydrogenase subunit 1